MPAKDRGIKSIPGLVGGSQRLAPNTAIDSKVEYLPTCVQRLRQKFSGHAISVAAANDYGSSKLFDLPNTELLIIAAVINLDVTFVNFTSLAGSVLDVALGTVATASTTFANAGEKDVMQKIDGTDVSSGIGKVKGQTDGSTHLKHVVAGASNAIFLNVSDPVASGTGTLSVFGWAEILFLDLGVA